MTDIVAALESLLRRGDTEGILALLLRLTTKRRPMPVAPGGQLPLPLGSEQPKPEPKPRSDDSLFATIMNNWDDVITKANQRKREREAKQEERRIAMSKQARETQTLEQQIAEIVARGKTPGLMLKLASDGTEWTIERWVSQIGCPANRVHVAAHTLETKGFLSRLRPGVYVARSSEGATNERWRETDREAKTLRRSVHGAGGG